MVEREAPEWAENGFESVEELLTHVKEAKGGG